MTNEWSKAEWSIHGTTYQLSNHEHNPIQLKRIIGLLEYAEQNFKQPMVIHVIGKITDEFDLKQIRDVLRTGLRAKNQPSEINTRFPFLYFATIEHKPSIGLHVHIMLIVDQSRFQIHNIRNLAIAALSKLRGVRLRADGTPDIDDSPRRLRNHLGQLMVHRTDHGVPIYTHLLKKELADAVTRYSYLTKMEQKENVPMVRTFSSSEIPVVEGWYGGRAA